MQKFLPTGKPRFIVSNRVFWAAVVLASAALLGSNHGQADPDAIRTKYISTQSLRVVDGTGKNAVNIVALPSGAILDLVSNGEREKLGLFVASDSGPKIVFTSKGKTGRIIGAGIPKPP